VSKQRGVTVSARKGYFANEESAANSATQQTTSITPVPPAISANSLRLRRKAIPSDTLREAVLAITDSTDLPIQVEVKQNATEISVQIHLDASAIPFRRDGDHNIDTITFAAAVFDSSDKVGVIKQRSAKLNITPEQLANVTANGINLPFTFPLEAGAHRIRAVVMESEQHKIGSLSKALGVN
jgi:hypothetical protein